MRLFNSMPRLKDILFVKYYNQDEVDVKLKFLFNFVYFDMDMDSKDNYDEIISIMFYQFPEIFKYLKQFCSDIDDFYTFYGDKKCRDCNQLSQSFQSLYFHGFLKKTTSKIFNIPMYSFKKAWNEIRDKLFELLFIYNDYVKFLEEIEIDEFSPEFSDNVSLVIKLCENDCWPISDKIKSNYIENEQVFSVCSDSDDQYDTESDQ